MAGSLEHSPADVLRYLLINHGMGVIPSVANNNTSWQIYADNEPDTPDNVITIYNTESRKNARTNPDNEIMELLGIQIRIRSSVSDVGYVKARDIAIELDENVYRENVTINSNSTYRVHSFSRTGGIIALGKEASTPSKRSVCVFNGLLTLKQCVFSS